MAFLLSFSALILASLIWMGLFVWLSGAESTSLNLVAAWLSPEGIPGWIFYLVLVVVCFLVLVRWKGGLK
jgi:hypothetical protein